MLSIYVMADTNQYHVFLKKSPCIKKKKYSTAHSLDEHLFWIQFTFLTFSILRTCEKKEEYSRKLKKY